MIDFFLSQLVWGTILAGVIHYRMFLQFNPTPENFGFAERKYVPLLSGLFLPVFMVTVMLMGSAIGGFSYFFEYMKKYMAGVFVIILVYDLLLLVILPFLRKTFSARACAALWMIPNYLYAFFYTHNFIYPLVTIRIPLSDIKVLVVIWFTGFVGILLYHIGSHLAFRKSLLKDAVTIEDERVLAIWNREISDAYVSPVKFRLVTSDHTKTPLSIGLFEKSAVVVLPHLNYTDEELALIFRHELVHIGREDACDKFFMAFCTAMFWFNPLIRIARKKSSEDLELSCDEMVMEQQDETTKRIYAKLLLETAADERGFTTCLSASAESLKYRMTNVIHSQKKRQGSILVGLVFVLLYTACGSFALTYGNHHAKDVLFNGSETVALKDVRFGSDDLADTHVVSDEEKLKEYLMSLELEDMTGEYSLNHADDSLKLSYAGIPHDIVLYKDYVCITDPEEDDKTFYHVKDPLNWELLNSYIR